MLSPDADDKLKELLRRTGEFIAYFEIAEGKMSVWKHDIEASFKVHEEQVQSQLASIKEHGESLNEIMTEAGAARWRIAAENSLKEGQDHLFKLEKLCQKQQDLYATQQRELQQIAHNNIEKIKKAENQIAAKINNLIKKINFEEVKAMTDQSRVAIEETTSQAVSQSRQLLKRFQLKTVALVFFSVAVTSLCMGLYISDEMPWEIHKHAMHERIAGQALLSAWPTLNQETKERIVSYSKRSLG